MTALWLAPMLLAVGLGLFSGMLLRRATRASGPRWAVRTAWLVGIQLALFGAAMGVLVGRALLTGP